MSLSVQELQQTLQSTTNWVVESEGDCLSISNDEGIDAFVYLGEQQLIVESVLFAESAVKNTQGLNTLILETHQFVPLSTVGISAINGERYYVVFGALSTDSKSSVIVEEIETLFSNVPEFLELYSEFLKTESAA